MSFGIIFKTDADVYRKALVHTSWKKNWSVSAMPLCLLTLFTINNTKQCLLKLWHRQFFATIEDDKAALLTRNIIGEDNLLWGSDYPHVDSTWPSSIAVLEEMFEDVDPIVLRKISYDNVKRLYGLSG